MPQDGSSNYQYPPGTRGIPDQTIESEPYNTFLDDLVNNDLNIARPVHRGGTGATAPDPALVNLGAEKAAQLVTNYEAHVWMPGSFRSSDATGQGAPIDGHAFVGICYINEPLVFPPTNANVLLELRDQDDTVKPGRRYFREKRDGFWGQWRGEAALVSSATPPVYPQDNALWWDADSGILYVYYNDGDSAQWVQAVALPGIDLDQFVATAGDTMTGFLTLNNDPLADMHAATKQYVDHKPSLVVGSDPPDPPKVNQLWWKDDTGTLFLNYNDGNSTQWVQVMPTPSSVVGEAPIDGTAYVRKDGAWVPLT